MPANVRAKLRARAGALLGEQVVNGGQEPPDFGVWARYRKNLKVVGPRHFSFTSAFWRAAIKTFGRIAAGDPLPTKCRCLTMTVTGRGGDMAKTLSGVARRELIDAVRGRYRISTRAEKRLIERVFGDHAREPAWCRMN